VTLSPNSDIARMVREPLMDPPLAQKLGLKPNDLNGAAQQARTDLLAGRSSEALGKFVRLILIDPTSTPLQIGLAEAALAKARQHRSRADRRWPRHRHRRRGHRVHRAACLPPRPRPAVPHRARP
jgi:hypothetical protein